MSRASLFAAAESAAEARAGGVVSDAVTVLQARVPLTKTHRRGETLGYARAKHFTGTVVEVEGIRGLSALLMRLEGEADRAIIRGRPRHGVDLGTPVRRLLHPDGSDDAVFEEVGRRWLCVDFDRLSCPAGLDPAAEPEVAVAFALRQLPRWLQGVTVHWQWSASAGLGGWEVLKLHLWFWLDAPVTDRALKAWARALDGVDPALYSAVQLHYTAAPAFEGVPDPVAGRRSGLLVGEVEVAPVPDTLNRWEEHNAARRAAASPTRPKPRVMSGGLVVQARYVEAAVERARQELEASSAGSRHDTVRSVGGSLANLVVWGWLDAQQGRATLNWSPLATLPGREHELDEVWGWCMKQARQNPQPPPELGAHRASTTDAGAYAVGSSDLHPPRSAPPAAEEPAAPPPEDDDPEGEGGPDPAWPDSDEGLAARLVQRYGARLRFVPGLGWLTYDRGLWRVQGPEALQVRRWARESASALRAEVEAQRPQGVAALTAPPDERSLWSARARFARSAEDAKRLGSACMVAESFEEVAAASEDLNADDVALCCPNGTVDLTTGRLRPHNPLELHTAQGSVAFDPAAVCPTWERFLLEIMGGDAELVAFLQRAVGYALTGRLDEQCFFVLHGDGSNGKSTFVGLVQELLGGYGRTAQFTTFGEQKDPSKPRSDLARLLGARFVAAAEPSASLRLDEGVVKQITGGDRLTTRFLHKNDFEFNPKFKLWLSTNTLPRIRGADHGIWRRVRLIPFSVQFRTKPDDPPEWPEADRTLPERLKAELPGIFAWAVRGCLDWQEGGLRPPPQVLQATDAYRIESDNVLLFLADRCLLSPACRTHTAELFDAYLRWCDDEGIEQRLTAKVFGKRLGQLPGLAAEKDRKGQRCWRGVGLLVKDGTCPEEDDAPF